jgi:tetratricopeptide (TPR) repeat protein
MWVHHDGDRDKEVLAVAAKLPMDARLAPGQGGLELTALARTGHTAERDAFVAEWKRRHPADDGADRLLVFAAIDLGRLDEAIERLERLVAKGAAAEDAARDRNELAWALLARGGDRRGAVANARKAVELRRAPGALHTLACALADQGELNEAIALVTELRGSFGERPAPLAFLLGIVAEKLGLPAVARQYYIRATAREPGERGPETILDIGPMARARLAHLSPG